MYLIARFDCQYDDEILFIIEEIIGDNSAMWFAPDGSRIAYVRFNDSLVSLNNEMSWFVYLILKDRNIENDFYNSCFFIDRWKKSAYQAIQNI